MKNLTADPFQLWDETCFVKLRDAACTRLTLLNAHRGGEPARMTVDEWTDTNNNKWIDQQRLQNLDQLDLVLIKNHKITYISGKGNNHLVLIQDTSNALLKLSDPGAKLGLKRRTGIYLNIFVWAYSLIIYRITRSLYIFKKLVYLTNILALSLWSLIRSTRFSQLQLLNQIYRNLKLRFRVKTTLG